MSTKKSISCIFSVLLTLALTFSALGATSAHAAGIRYAAPDGTGDCSSWAKACILQTALTRAGSGDEVWAAAGTHKPTTDPANRVATFQLKSGVAIYGGFVGTETARDQRNPATNVTILSGDIDNNDSQTPIITDLATVTGNTTNSYHVVAGAANATLDGFTISAGNANDSASPNNGGGGMYNYSSNSLALTNVSFSGNNAGYGGGMLNAFSSPTLTYVTFNGNAATNSGGGVLNYSSSPTLTNITFSNNSAGWGGGMYNESSSSPVLLNITFSGNSAGYGGGMENNGSNPMLTSVTFDGNTATSSGGGMLNYSSSPTLTDTTFNDNSAGWGGGMYNESNSSPALTNITFNSNTASDSGGGMYNYSSSPTLTGVTFSGNSASCGGGMYNDTSNPILTDVTFSSNTAAISGGFCGLSEIGGGMYNSSSNPTLTDVTFINNSAYYGGGMVNWGGSPTLTNVTFSGNSSNQQGGGMYNQGGDPTLTNVIFSGNSSGTNGGGMFNGSHANPTLMNVTFSGNLASWGGGISNDYYSSPTLTNVTFSSNSAYQGGGIYNEEYSSPHINNTIFWGNTATNAGAQIYNKDANAIPNISYSVIQDGCPAGSACTNIITIDPKLGTLGDYGGFTQTIPLLAGSSAIDTGNDPVCPATDQRGVSRPQDGDNDGVVICDIGAYEVEKAYTLMITSAHGTVTKNPDEAAYHEGDVVQLTATPTVGWVFASWTGDLISSSNPDSLTIHGNTSVTANYTQNEYNLTITSANGTVAKNPDKPTYHEGDVVQLTATPSAGWVFVNWTGALTGAANPGSITIHGNATITANYKKLANLTRYSIAANDGWALEKGETLNKGGSVDAASTTFRLGDDNLKKQYRSILSFNTSGLPDNAIITSVTLKIRQESITGSATFNRFQGLLVDIRKGTFGTSALQVTDFQATASTPAAGIGPFILSPVGDWYTINLTAGKAYINKLATLLGLTQFRLRFKLDDNNNAVANYISFFSGNNSTNKPTLIIQYYVP